MKLCWCLLVSFVLPTCSLFAATTIEFEQIQASPGTPDITDFAIDITKIDWVQGGPFTADQLNSREFDEETGQVPTLFHNASNKTFIDFHILINSPTSLEVPSHNLGGDPFFDDVGTTVNTPPSQQATIITVDYSEGDGIPHCTYFAIGVDGFPEGTTFSLRPTVKVVPAPGALTLCAVGVALTRSLRRRRALR